MKHVSQISFDFKWDDEKPYDMEKIEHALIMNISEIEVIYGMDCCSMDEQYKGALE